MVNSAAVETNSSGTRRPETEPDQPVRTRRHRENADDENGNGVVRYFLGKTESNGGSPSLEKEVATEGEALVESLRQGVTFYAIQEFRAIADFSGRRPQLTKEPILAKKD